MAPVDWVIERLARHHDRTGFDCGHVLLNDWLKLRAGQFERRDLARTYVAVRRGEKRVSGYYAVSNHYVRYDALAKDQAKGLPHIDVPVILLGRLAVDRTESGQGLGSLLVIDALRRALHVSEQVGVRAIEVDAFDEAARRFYLKFGFTELSDDRRHLFLPMHLVRKLDLPRLS